MYHEKPRKSILPSLCCLLCCLIVVGLIFTPGTLLLAAPYSIYTKYKPFSAYSIVSEIATNVLVRSNAVDAWLYSGAALTVQQARTPVRLPSKVYNLNNTKLVNVKNTWSYDSTNYLTQMPFTRDGLLFYATLGDTFTVSCQQCETDGGKWVFSMQENSIYMPKKKDDDKPKPPKPHHKKDDEHHKGKKPHHKGGKHRHHTHEIPEVDEHLVEEFRTLKSKNEEQARKWLHHKLGQRHKRLHQKHHKKPHREAPHQQPHKPEPQEGPVQHTFMIPFDAGYRLQFIPNKNNTRFEATISAVRSMYGIINMDEYFWCDGDGCNLTPEQWTKGVVVPLNFDNLVGEVSIQKTGSPMAGPILLSPSIMLLVVCAACCVCSCGCWAICCAPKYCGNAPQKNRGYVHLPRPPPAQYAITMPNNTSNYGGVNTHQQPHSNYGATNPYNYSAASYEAPTYTYNAGDYSVNAYSPESSQKQAPVAYQTTSSAPQGPSGGYIPYFSASDPSLTRQ